MPETMIAAGRALDALVAEMVFGREVEHHARGIHNTGPTRGYHDDLGFKDTRYPRSDWQHHMRHNIWPGEKVEVPEDLHHYTRVPDYSTDLAAAWLVVENLRKCDLSLDLNEDKTRGAEAAWRAEFADEDYNVAGDGRGPTAPLAICRAALAAVETR